MDCTYYATMNGNVPDVHSLLRAAAKRKAALRNHSQGRLVANIGHLMECKKVASKLRHSISVENVLHLFSSSLFSVFKITRVILASQEKGFFALTCCW